MKQPIMTVISLALILVAISCTLSAGSFYRCKDDHGRTVFSQTQCGGDAEEQALKSAQAVGRGESSRTAMEQLEVMRAISGRDRVKRNRRSKRSRSQCPELDSTQRRNLLVGRQLFKCMTQEEVIRVMEQEPFKRRSDSSGLQSWYFKHKDGSSTRISFREDGRVKGWSKSRVKSAK